MKDANIYKFPVIDVKNLNKYFAGKHAVKDLSLQVNRGEIFAFLGPNGSGKTTSIRMICGLLTPDSGSGTCLGYDIFSEQALLKSKIGYMSQRFSYWEELTIEENLYFMAKLYQLPRPKKLVARAIDQLGLSAFANHLAGHLSGGWKQRLALATCMLHEPEILFLDEPTAGVDPKSRREFWEELHLLAATGISILVSTHYMDEAERCDKLAYISYGNLLYQGMAEALIAEQKLVTWSATGPHLFVLSEQLKNAPGVEQTIIFGNSLHVSGKDALALEQSVREIAKPEKYRLEKIDTNLEDVFIYLIKDVYDNPEA